jgi:hypothetical protein
MGNRSVVSAQPANYSLLARSGLSANLHSEQWLRPTCSTSGVTANTYGSSATVPASPVNDRGQVTSVTNTAINRLWNSNQCGCIQAVTTGLTTSGGPIIGSGTITLSGLLIAANGGTGSATYAVGDLLYASTTTALSKLADVAAGTH